MPPAALGLREAGDGGGHCCHMRGRRGHDGAREVPASRARTLPLPPLCCGAPCPSGKGEGCGVLGGGDERAGSGASGCLVPPGGCLFLFGVVLPETRAWILGGAWVDQLLEAQLACALSTREFRQLVPHLRGATAPCAAREPAIRPEPSSCPPQAPACSWSLGWLGCFQEREFISHFFSLRSSIFKNKTY